MKTKNLIILTIILFAVILLSTTNVKAATSEGSSIYTYLYGEDIVEVEATKVYKIGSTYDLYGCNSSSERYDLDKKVELPATYKILPAKNGEYSLDSTARKITFLKASEDGQEIEVYYTTDGVTEELLSWFMVASEEEWTTYTKEGVTKSGLTYTIESNPDEDYIVINGITDTTVKTLEIPATIDGYSVREISENAFKGNKSLEKVIFSSSLKIVSAGAFSGCSNLKEVVLKGKDLFLYPRVFEGTAIETIKFTESITGVNRGLDSAAFTGMNNLKSIYFETNDGMWIWDNEMANEQLSETTLNYLKNNVTIYGYTSKYEQDDSIDNVTLSPKGFATSRGIKFVDLDTLEVNSLTDGKTKITVGVNMSKTAQITVTALDKTSEEYKNIVKDLKDYEVALAYDISITAGDYEGPITVTIPLDAKYNGKTATILHKKADGTIEKFTNTVVDGKVEVKVTELSPFVVTFAVDKSDKTDSGVSDSTDKENTQEKPEINNEKPNTEENKGSSSESNGKLDESPKMGVNDMIIFAGFLAVISVAGIVITKRMK